MWQALGLAFRAGPWPHFMPDIAFAMIYILSVVLCFAVGVLGSYHLWGVSNGETSVEAQDHEQYRNRAKARRETFVNSYDLGRRRNLALFFNIGENGYPWYTLLLPLRVPPYTDGRSWARREGHDRHQGLREGEEVTDESEDDGEWED